MLFVVLLVSISLQLVIRVESVDHGVDLNYCNENLMSSKSTELMFSKELSKQEYGIVNKPKSIHCCAKNFDTIQWFKNNESYPWRSNASNFKVDDRLSSKNQTLFADKLESKDRGIYTCVIKSGDSVLQRVIDLEVYGQFQGEPQMTFEPPMKVTADVRDSVRLYCETFVGKIDLPDANNDIQWSKKDSNNTLTDDKNLNIHVEKISRDDGITLGMYLIINKVEPNDFGDYVCSASNTGDQITHRTSQIARNEYTSLLYIGLAIGICVVIILLVLLCYKYGYNFMLFIRPYVTRVKCGKNENQRS